MFLPPSQVCTPRPTYNPQVRVSPSSYIFTLKPCSYTQAIHKPCSHSQAIFSLPSPTQAMLSLLSDALNPKPRFYLQSILSLPSQTLTPGPSYDPTINIFLPLSHAIALEPYSYPQANIFYIYTVSRPSGISPSQAFTPKPVRSAAMLYLLSSGALFS